MSKSTKIWLILATCFLIIGMGIFVLVLALNDWNFSEIGGNKYQTNTYTITEDFNEISIDTDTTDIVIREAEDGICKIECYEHEKMRHTASVKNNKLSITAVDERKFYDNLFAFKGPKVTVYLPSAEYKALVIKENTGDIEIGKELHFESADITLSTGDVSYSANTDNLLKIKTSTGDIRVNDISVGELKLSVSTGDIIAKSIVCGGNITVTTGTGDTTMTGVTCKSFTSTGTTGDITLNNIVLREKLSVRRDTGDVTLNGCDAAEITITTSTGDVVGSFLSNKTVVPHTSTGDIRVPSNGAGGKCEITTDTGDITIRITQP